MDESESAQGDAESEFILTKRDYQEVLAPAQRLLWRIARSSLLNAAALEAIAKLIRAFDGLPKAFPQMEIDVSLTGPRRWFGEHEIYHFWTIRTERGSGLLEVDAGGHFYRRSTGGDTFTSLQWTVFPGSESQYDNYLHTLGIVDDAAPFGEEIERISLTEDGYSLEIVMNGETLSESSGE